VSRPPAPVTGRTHIHRVVSDMKAAIDFYTRMLGFHYDHGVREVAWLTRTDTLLTLSPGEVAPDRGSYFGIAMPTAEELDALYKWLYERRQRLSGPPDTSGSYAQFFLYDPDGYPVIFSWQRLDYV
jgi:catechol 2,3-dioxygenase-like lactoylglutathione lyase family enzyme